MVSCVNIVRGVGERDKNWKVTTGSGNKAVLGDLDTCSLSGPDETEAHLEQFEAST